MCTLFLTQEIKEIKFLKQRIMMKITWKPLNIQTAKFNIEEDSLWNCFGYGKAGLWFKKENLQKKM